MFTSAGGGVPLAEAPAQVGASLLEDAGPRPQSYFGGGGTKQVVVRPSMDRTTSSSGPVMWTRTAPAWQFVDPIFFELGLAPGAWVYLTTVPEGKGPKVTPPVTTKTFVPTSDPMR